MTRRSLRLALLAVFCVLPATGQSPAPAAPPASRPLWGRIANTLHHGERLFSALFFAGLPNPGSVPLYTRHPRTAGKRTTGDGDMDGALALLASAGLNTVKLSYWGHDGETDSSAPAYLFSRTRWPGDAKGSPRRSGVCMPSRSCGAGPLRASR